MTLTELNDLIADACPIEGINSVGMIWFKPEATAEQKQQAESLMQQHLKDIP